ncbi:hypothetical protein BKA70DRAFT_1237686 [Coprinopsis sp. MPI-PUGE-AT-0042]|nr:hypothetical protein BKA70DRAFT_1237686 [Coprinopsis sp. MPI-PUGE-AT-0042]
MGLFGASIWHSLMMMMMMNVMLIVLGERVALDRLYIWVFLLVINPALYLVDHFQKGPRKVLAKPGISCNFGGGQGRSAVTTANNRLVPSCLRHGAATPAHSNRGTLRTTCQQPDQSTAFAAEHAQGRRLTNGGGRVLKDRGFLLGVKGYAEKSGPATRGVELRASGRTEPGPARAAMAGLASGSPCTTAPLGIAYSPR